MCFDGQSGICFRSEWMRIKGKSWGLLGGGVIGENRGVIGMGIFMVVSEKIGFQILRREEVTERMGGEEGRVKSGVGDLRESGS